MSWTEGIDAWKIFTEIGRVILWVVGKVVDVFNWGHFMFVQAGGDPAGLLYIILLVVFVPFIAFMWTISGTQASMENLQRFGSSLAIRLILIGIIIFVILFVFQSAS